MASWSFALPTRASLATWRAGLDAEGIVQQDEFRQSKPKSPGRRRLKSGN
jgi:hypothetical protein